MNRLQFSFCCGVLRIGQCVFVSASLTTHTKRDLSNSELKVIGKVNTIVLRSQISIHASCKVRTCVSISRPPQAVHQKQTQQQYKQIGANSDGWVIHERWCRAVSSRRLIPGDVLVLLRGKATCDMVLLRGNCLVEESMLSGEACCLRLYLLQQVNSLLWATQCILHFDCAGLQCCCSLLLPPDVATAAAAEVTTKVAHTIAAAAALLLGSVHCWCCCCCCSCCLAAKAKLYIQQQRQQKHCNVYSLSKILSSARAAFCQVGRALARS